MVIEKDGKVLYQSLGEPIAYRRRVAIGAEPDVCHVLVFDDHNVFVLESTGEVVTRQGWDDTSRWFYKIEG